MDIIFWNHNAFDRFLSSSVLIFARKRSIAHLSVRELGKKELFRQNWANKRFYIVNLIVFHCELWVHWSSYFLFFSLVSYSCERENKNWIFPALNTLQSENKVFLASFDRFFVVATKPVIKLHKILEFVCGSYCKNQFFLEKPKNPVFKLSSFCIVYWHVV